MFKTIFNTVFSVFTKAGEIPIYEPTITPEPTVEPVVVNNNMFTSDKLAKIFPSTSRKILDRFVDPLNITCEKFEINTPKRAAAFIAQVGHESGGFIYTKENLNYSAAGLLKVFPKYFTQSTANAYARKPEKIANRVYANRMGNGNEASGDGWKFSGKGILQITGRDNTSRFAKYMGMTIDEACAYLLTDEGATVSAGWFWEVNNLNTLADADRFTDLTKRINGGTNGLAHRQELWALAKKAL